MNKKLMVIAGLMLFMVTAQVAFAQKGASDQAKEHASENAIFNRVGDWFATIGKNDEEKQKILTERKAKRMAEKAEKKAMEKKKEAEHKAKEMKSKMMKGK